MIVFPNCKINLGLNITSKRPDGYHNLETVFFPIQLRDALEIIRKPVIKTENGSLTNAIFSSSGLSVTENHKDNICLKAYNILFDEYREQLSSLEMHLHKKIPTGAGLGGGSADGAFTLKLLNQLFRLNLSVEQLLNYALQLGSDCPFFILNKPCFATGRGEILEELNLDLTGYKIVIVNPGIHISTPAAFSKIKPTVPSKSIREIIVQPIETWKNELKNDFEFSVFDQYPEIAAIKERFYNKGAVYASMSGSGSTVFGIFKKGEQAEFNFPNNYFNYIENI